MLGYNSSHMDDCIFDKIIRREVPADIVYEDENTLAFLDIAPTSKGHTLVIPKKHVQDIFETDDETLAATMRTVHNIASTVRDSVGAKGVHVSSNHGAAAGQVVFHLHFHIIPRQSRTEFEFWPHVPYAPGEAAAIAEKIRTTLSGSTN